MEGLQLSVEPVDTKLLQDSEEVLEVLEDSEERQLQLSEVDIKPLQVLEEVSEVLEDSADSAEDTKLDQEDLEDNKEAPREPKEDINPVQLREDSEVSRLKEVREDTNPDQPSEDLLPLLNKDQPKEDPDTNPDQLKEGSLLNNRPQSNNNRLDTKLLNQWFQHQLLQLPEDTKLQLKSPQLAQLQLQLKHTRPHPPLPNSQLK